jgi:MtfA peptidase
MVDKAFIDTWSSFLDDYHLYYRNLGQKAKQKFLKRVNSIYHNVDIIGKEGLEVTEEIKILVVSNLVQLTFGLKEYWLYGYDYIHLHPGTFMLPKSGEFVKGSTYNTKIIALSWEHFAFDHLHPQFGRNVSLAQYALALLRTVFNGKHYDLHFGSYIDTWFEIIKKECELKSSGSEYQRFNENAEDLNYIFSQCVEIFFERPEVLKKDLPSTYAHLCLLLNQDPGNSFEDYKYDRESLNKSPLISQLPKHVPVHYKYKNWHWLYNFSFFGLTLCPLIMYFQIDKLLIQVFDLFGFATLCSIITAIFIYKPLKSIGIFERFWVVFLNCFLGYIPSLLTLLICINNLGSLPGTSVKSKHEIITYYLSESYINRERSNPVTFILQNHYLEEHPHARTFESFDKTPVNGHNFFNGIEYDIRKGWLGLPIIYSRDLY